MTDGRQEWRIKPTLDARWAVTSPTWRYAEPVLATSEVAQKFADFLNALDVAKEEIAGQMQRNGELLAEVLEVRAELAATQGKAALADRAKFTVGGVAVGARLLKREQAEAAAWIADYDALTTVKAEGSG